MARNYRLGPVRRAVNGIMPAGLHHYVRAVAVTRPYFDAGPDDPDTAFVDEAAKHPVFRLAETNGPR